MTKVIEKIKQHIGIFAEAPYQRLLRPIVPQQRQKRWGGHPVPTKPPQNNQFSKQRPGWQRLPTLRISMRRDKFPRNSNDFGGTHATFIDRRPLGRLAACLAALTLSSASFALAPYDSTGATIELVPVAGGAAVATTRVTFPPDAATVNLAIPPSVIAAMAPGTSLSFFARVTSDALTAGSTCTANALSRQITFTKAGSATAATVPTLGTLGLVLLAGLMGVAAYRNRRLRGALNVLLPVIAIAALSFGSAPSLNAQATDPNTTYAGSVNDAIQSVRAVVDAAGNVGVTGTRANNCDVLPVAPVGSGFANLVDITVSDNTGNGIVPFSAGGVVDPIGRVVTYSASGLPNDVNGFLSIDPTTGQIFGTYDANGIPAGSAVTPFTITVVASNGVKSISRTFVLSIRNDG